MQDSVSQDTPVNRATIAQLEVDQLDEMLTRLRNNRLMRVRYLESLANASADEVGLGGVIKYNKLRDQIKKKLAKMEELDLDITTKMNTLRVLQVQLGLDNGSSSS